jgi:hypothetical protein
MISGGHISPIALRIPPPGSPARRTQTGPAREQSSVTWYDLACRFTDMKWPRLAAKSRMSIADALATITPALVTTTRGMPDPQTFCVAGGDFVADLRLSARRSR